MVTKFLMTKNTTYADAGVHLELGDDASKVLYEAAKQTWENRRGKLIKTPSSSFFFQTS